MLQYDTKKIKFQNIATRLNKQRAAAAIRCFQCNVQSSTRRKNANGLLQLLDRANRSPRNEFLVVNTFSFVRANITASLELMKFDNFEISLILIFWDECPVNASLFLHYAQIWPIIS